MKIIIEEYKSDWVIIFQQIKHELSVHLESLNPQIEHIGSTSVPGLAAKPVIDIVVGIETLEDLDKTIEPMIRNRYIYYELFNSDIPERRLFVKLKEGSDHAHFKQIYSENDILPHEEINRCRLAHVHIWKYGTPDWIRHIAYRDYLRTHPLVREEYEALKRELSLKSWKHGMEYNDGKDDFIRIEQAKAVEWYQRTQES
jgi:GrpB-like predicted nucleotidyltransferase (UPF0157 family)